MTLNNMKEEGYNKVLLWTIALEAQLSCLIDQIRDSGDQSSSSSRDQDVVSRDLDMISRDLDMIQVLLTKTRSYFKTTTTAFTSASYRINIKESSQGSSKVAVASRKNSSKKSLDIVTESGKCFSVSVTSQVKPTKAGTKKEKEVDLNDQTVKLEIDDQQQWSVEDTEGYEYQVKRRGDKVNIECTQIPTGKDRLNSEGEEGEDPKDDVVGPDQSDDEYLPQHSHINGHKSKGKNERPKKLRKKTKQKTSAALTKSASTEVDGPVTCDQCERTFKLAISLKRHIKFRRCPGKPSDGVKYTCECCHRDFYGDVNFIRHQKKNLTCEQCGKIFCQNILLKRHLITHQTDRPFNCDICGLTFKDVDRLKAHKKLTHLYHPEGCKLCGKVVRNKSILARHMAAHRQDRPHQCDVCPSKFRFKFQLDNHKTSVHEPRVLVSCSICNKLMKPENVKVHLKTHEENRETFACGICGKKMLSISILKNHQKVHSQDCPYTCDVCYKSFKSSTALNRHRKIHNPDEHSSCQVCTRRFSHKGSLMRHLSKVHNISNPNVTSFDVTDPNISTVEIQTTTTSNNQIPQIAQ